MQKNNCKLKTIFKKGLSFSIALALGAAATSLNLAKTAEATAPVVTDGTVRKIYLSGEKIDVATGIANGVTKIKVNDDATEITDVANYVMTEAVTKVTFGNNDGDADATTGFKVYDWAKIYTGTSVKVEHDTTTGKHNDIRDAVVGNLNLTIGDADHLTAIKNLLKNGELQLTDGTKIDRANYAEYNNKEVQIKLNGVVCPLGTLEVDRSGELQSIELLSWPTEYCYITGETINLAGLAIKLNYSVGDSETVAWTAETDGKFTFSSVDVGDGKGIAANISDVSVTYGGQTTEEKFSLFLCKNISKEAGNIAKVDGVFDKLDEVSAVALSDDSEKI